MALIINNQTIETREGLPVSGGTYVAFNTIFPNGKLEVHYNMEFYVDQTAYTNGSSKYFPKDLQSLGHVETMPKSEFTGLTPTIVHQKLKDYLETVYTGASIDIVL
jgi:hypothetical protein